MLDVQDWTLSQGLAAFVKLSALCFADVKNYTHLEGMLKLHTP